MCFKVGVVVQAFNLKHSESRDKQVSEFESGLVYVPCSQARQGHTTRHCHKKTNKTNLFNENDIFTKI